MLMGNQYKRKKTAGYERCKINYSERIKAVRLKPVCIVPTDKIM